MRWPFLRKTLPAAIVRVGLVLIVSLLSPVGLPPETRAQSHVELPRDAVILLDITRSMRGEGRDPAARDIWDDVVARVSEQVSSFSDGTNLAIVPFADGPRVRSVWPIATRTEDEAITLATVDPDTRSSALTYLGQLGEPDGQATHICDSLRYALQRLDDWRRGQPDRLQTVYLYTDGLDTGSCAEDFAESLVELFNGERADYPYLYGVYIDLNGALTDDDVDAIEQGTQGHVDHSVGIPPIVTVEPSAVELGNLYGVTDGVEVILRFGNLPAGELLTAHLDLVPSDLGLEIEPQGITLAGEVAITLSPSSPEPGPHAGAIRLQRRGGNYVLGNSTIAVTYDWVAPPTPTAVPTEAPTSTPAPSPTPIGVVTITANPPPGDLGRVAGGVPLVGQIDVAGAFNDAAANAQTEVRLEALADGQLDPAKFAFVASDGTRASTTVLRPDSPSAVAEYNLARAGGGLLPGAERHDLALRVVEAQQGEVRATNGEALEALPYGYTIEHPFGLQHLLALGAVLALLLVAAYVLFHARFPKDAEMVVEGGSRHPLRSVAERSLMARMFGRRVTVGGPADDIDAGNDERLGLLSASRSRVGVFGGGVHFTPSTRGEESPVRIDGEPPTGTTRLHPGSSIATPGATLTYEIAETWDVPSDFSEDYSVD